VRMCGSVCVLVGECVCVEACVLQCACRAAQVFCQRCVLFVLFQAKYESRGTCTMRTFLTFARSAMSSAPPGNFEFVTS
jgi:hypothetical protein